MSVRRASLWRVVGLVYPWKDRTRAEDVTRYVVSEAFPSQEVAVRCLEAGWGDTNRPPVIESIERTHSEVMVP